MLDDVWNKIFFNEEVVRVFGFMDWYYIVIGNVLNNEVEMF